FAYIGEFSGGGRPKNKHPPGAPPGGEPPQMLFETPPHPPPQKRGGAGWCPHQKGAKKTWGTVHPEKPSRSARIVSVERPSLQKLLGSGDGAAYLDQHSAYGERVSSGFSS